MAEYSAAALRSAGVPASIGLEGALAQARRFRTPAVQVENVAQALRIRADAGSADFELRAGTINRCLKRLSRLLIPTQSTAVGTYGHDMYGYTPQSDQRRAARRSARIPPRGTAARIANAAP